MECLRMCWIQIRENWGARFLLDKAEDAAEEEEVLFTNAFKVAEVVFQIWLLFLFIKWFAEADVLGKLLLRPANSFKGGKSSGVGSSSILGFCIMISNDLFKILNLTAREFGESGLYE